MFGKASQNEIAQELWQRLDHLERLIQDIHVSLIVRDIPTQRTMDAYEGLRKQVGLAARARREHQAQLVQLQEVLQAGATSEDVARLSGEWCLQAGIREVWDFGDGSLFAIEGDSSLNAVQVHRPAWTDSESGSLIRQGIAVRVHIDLPEPTILAEVFVDGDAEDTGVQVAEPDPALDESSEQEAPETARATVPPEGASDGSGPQEDADNQEEHSR